MKKTIERINLKKEDLLSVETDIRFHEHLRRYAAVRRFCYGKVLDFACGCGYGSYLLSQNPDVEQVFGLDIDAESISWAKKEFKNNKTQFFNAKAETFKKKVDTLVCLETIEHLQHPKLVVELANRCGVKNVIVSFPDKKSTHFNHFHLHDFVRQDIIDFFVGFIPYHSFRSGDVQFILFVKAPDGMPDHISNNILDL